MRKVVSQKEACPKKKEAKTVLLRASASAPGIYIRSIQGGAKIGEKKTNHRQNGNTIYSVETVRVVQKSFPGHQGSSRILF